MSVLTVRLLPGVAFGMVTFGVLSNAPVAVTAVFAPGEAAAEDEEDAEDDEEAVDFDDPPQPARTRQASKGMAMSARKRRMKNLNSGGCQPRQPTVLAGGTIPPRPPLLLGGPIPPDPPWGAFGPQTSPYIPAMSFSTRSSTERNGSLHSTVRWAWSFSLRCTQSTVKSRRFSWARRMNSPRSSARDIDIFEAKSVPPQTTRAKLRGEDS